MSRPRLGLALGGGGARGLAHVGVLKVLEREAIAVGAVAGSSMGGLIGAAYAAGTPVARIEAAVLELADRSRFFSLVDRLPTGRGLLSGARVRAYLAERMGEALEFAALARPLALTAVDLESGHEVVLREGSVVDAMRATMSMPGVFAPCERSDGTRLVDGGVLNNLPVDLPRALGAERVVAVDVLPELPTGRPGAPGSAEPMALPFVPGLARDLWQTQMVMMAALTAARLRDHPPDLLLRPELPADVTILVGFARAAEIVAAGERAAEEALPALRRLAGR